MPKVLVTPIHLAKLQDTPYLHALREAGFEVAFPSKYGVLTEDELIRDLDGVAATLASMERYTPRVFAARPELRAVARVGVGYDAVDVPAATQHGIAVTITPGTNQDAVAEHTFALMLALAKDVVPQHCATKVGQWPRRATLPLRGTALGLLGLGRIGKAVATRGAAFGMKLLAHEPYPDSEFVAKYNVTLLPLDDVLRQADWVSLHVPMSAEAQHLVCKKTLALMKPTAFLINTARGGLVCEADLVEALKEKRIAGAGLDVFEKEPPGETPLGGFDNVVLTPHAAGVDLKSRDDMALSAARSIVALSRGEWPAECVVNPDVRERFKW
jgi:D-3-phosphoglycerate dehydrogenase / 2-oxoglutarate reductase